MRPIKGALHARQAILALLDPPIGGGQIPRPPLSTSSLEPLTQ
ncbi:MAG: hypothetical protein ACJAW4_003403 [Paracoccaceae bacterium]|jgi:hypothetical protein